MTSRAPAARALAAAGLVVALVGCTSDASTSSSGAPAGAAAAAVPAPVPSSATPSVAPSPSRPPAPVSTFPVPAGQLHRKLTEIATGYQPKQVAFSPSGQELWVTPLGSAAGVEVYDAVSGARTHQIDLGTHGAVEIVFTRDGGTAYVSQMETGSVFAIDARTYAVTRQYATKGVWTKVVALSPDERTLYASNWESDDVSAIDLASGSVRLYPTVDTPRGLYVTPDGATLYVAGYDDGEIQRIDLATGAGRVLLRTGGAMRHLVADPAGERLYANDMARDTEYVVDLRTDEVTTLGRTDRLPNTTDVSPDGRVVYVANRGRNGRTYLDKGPEWGSVVVLDAHTGAPLDAIVGGNQTTALDVSPDGTRLAFSDFLDSRVNVYEIPPYDVLAAGRGGRFAAHRAELAK